MTRNGLVVRLVVVALLVAAPAVLDSLVGVSLVLTGASSSTMAGRSPEKSKMETAVLFRNHPGF